MTDARPTPPPDSAPTVPGLDDMQQWTLVMGRAQQMLMEAWADNLAKGSAHARASGSRRRPPAPTRWRG